MMKDNIVQFVDQANEANRAAYQTAGQLAETHFDTWQKLVDVQLDFFGKTVDAASKQAKAASEAKDYRQFLSSQAEFIQSYGQQCADSVRQTVNVISGARDAYGSVVEEGVKSAQESAKESVKTVKEATAAKKSA